MERGYSMVEPRRVEPLFIYDHGKPWLDQGMTTIVERWFRSRFCRGTPILNLDNSPEVDEWRSKSGSRISNHFVFLHALFSETVESKK